MSASLRSAFCSITTLSTKLTERQVLFDTCLIANFKDASLINVFGVAVLDHLRNLKSIAILRCPGWTGVKSVAKYLLSHVRTASRAFAVFGFVRFPPLDFSSERLICATEGQTRGLKLFTTWRRRFGLVTQATGPGLPGIVQNRRAIPCLNLCPLKSGCVTVAPKVYLLSLVVTLFAFFPYPSFLRLRSKIQVIHTSKRRQELGSDPFAVRLVLRSLLGPRSRRTLPEFSGAPSTFAYSSKNRLG